MTISLPHFGPHTFFRRQRGAAYVGPFDGITFAALYGMKRFLTAYTGSLVRLRRDSDNAESDFGYVEATGLLDTAAIATWLGGANGFVVTWYDQSGNGLDITQSTAGAQAAYNSTAVNSLPALSLDGDDLLARASVADTALATSSDVSILLAMYQNSADTVNVPFSWNPGTNEILLFATLSSTFYWDVGNFGSGGRISGAAPGGWANAWHVVTARRSSGAASVYVDGGSAAVSGTMTDALDAATNTLRIGGTGTAGDGLTGYIAVCAVLKTGISAADHNTIGGELGTLYGITWNTVS